MSEKEYKEIKVKASSNVNSLSGCIVTCFENRESIELRAIGAGAVNQAVKACASARSILAGQGHDIAFIPGFTKIEGPNGKDDEKTVIVLRLREL